MIYYFAYGSNMDQVQMKERCPDSKLFGRACLKNYQLAFTIYSPLRKCGCADVVSKDGGEVWGLLYKINKKDLTSLDRFEAHPIKYIRQTCEVVCDNGQKIQAEFYIVVDKSVTPIKTSTEYLTKLLDAARKFNFPANYVDHLLNFAEN